MGIVFGRTGVDEPVFRLVARSAKGYEVRCYPGFVTATVHERLGPNGNSGAFRILAGYIGVTSAPKNRGAQALAMTAPVVQTPTQQPPVAMAMTAPVVQTPTAGAAAASGEDFSAAVGRSYREGDMSLAFILPSKYTEAAACPTPLDPRVVLKAHPPRLVACAAFTGWVTDAAVATHLAALLGAVRSDGLRMQLAPGATAAESSAGGEAGEAPPHWQVAQYNPPFTIPWMRRNEIWVGLDVTEETAAEACT